MEIVANWWLFVFSVWNICVEIVKNETQFDLYLLTCGTSKCGPCRSMSELKNVASDMECIDH